MARLAVSEPTQRTTDEDVGDRGRLQRSRMTDDDDDDTDGRRPTTGDGHGDDADDDKDGRGQRSRRRGRGPRTVDDGRRRALDLLSRARTQSLPPRPPAPAREPRRRSCSLRRGARRRCGGRSRRPGSRRPWSSPARPCAAGLPPPMGLPQPTATCETAGAHGRRRTWSGRIPCARRNPCPVRLCQQWHRLQPPHARAKRRAHHRPSTRPSVSAAAAAPGFAWAAVAGLRPRPRPTPKPLPTTSRRVTLRGSMSRRHVHRSGPFAAHRHCTSAFKARRTRRSSIEILAPHTPPPQFGACWCRSAQATTSPDARAYANSSLPLTPMSEVSQGRLGHR